MSIQLGRIEEDSRAMSTAENSRVLRGRHWVVTCGEYTQVQPRCVHTVQDMCEHSVRTCVQYGVECTVCTLNGT